MASAAIAGVLYFQPAIDSVEALVRFKRAIDGAEPYRGGVLHPAETSQADWDAIGEAPSGGILLAHDQIAAELGMQLWMLDVHYRTEETADLGKLESMSSILPVSPIGVGMSWGLLLHLMPRLISMAGPDLAMVNGNEDVAWGSDLVRGELPAFFAPFTYLGPTRLTDERRRALGALPDCRTEKLGDGWVVQAVTDLHQKVSPAFVSALAAMPNEKRIRYKQSRPPRDKTVGSKSR